MIFRQTWPNMLKIRFISMALCGDTMEQDEIVWWFKMSRYFEINLWVCNFGGIDNLVTSEKLEEQGWQ